MDAKTNVLVGGNVGGVISNCQVNSTDVSKSSWTIETIGVNSCTGQIVSDSTYFHWGAFICVFVFAVIFIYIFVKASFK